MPMTRYAVVIEKADDNYSAYVPDLPGCVAVLKAEMRRKRGEIGRDCRCVVAGSWL